MKNDIYILLSEINNGLNFLKVHIENKIVKLYPASFLMNKVLHATKQTKSIKVVSSFICLCI